MCTSITFTAGNPYMGRNLDLENSFGQRVVITPRQFPFAFHRLPALREHQAMIGMACVADDYPLYAEAVNESGVYIAGLKFPGNALYTTDHGQDGLAPYELIPWLLGQCSTASEAVHRLSERALLAIPFRPDLPLAPLHWHIADRESSFVAEPLAEGIKVYPDPVGVLTNNPAFEFHMTNLHQYMGLSSAQPENRFHPQLNLQPFGHGMGGLGLPGDCSPASRFIRAAFCKWNAACGPEERDAVSQFFHILDSVAMPRGAVRTSEGKWDYTLYSCCINASTGTYYYKTYDNCALTAVKMGERERQGNTLLEFPLEHKLQIHWAN